MAERDGVLLLGFGGVTAECCGRKATCPGRVECFVSKVLGDDPRQAARVAEVAAHYHHLGGTSPYNELTFAQAAALEAELARRGRPMPVRCGFRNYPPWYVDGLAALRDAGCTRYRAVVLSGQRTQRGWEDYLDQCAEAAAGVDAAPARLGAIEPYFDDPGFIQANAERIREALAAAGWDDERFAAAELILTAHAIPVPAERSSPYRAQVATTAGLVAEACGHPRHALGFQSAPDQSRIPWSTPRVEELVAEAAERGAQDIVVQAVGFLVDHVEVLFDLDQEVAAQCDALGVGYLRARCVHDHPAFIAALADRVLALG